jgi:putative MFS transporter
LPLVLLKIGIGEEDTTSDGVLNLFLLLGSLGGLWRVAKMTHRGLTIWSFLLPLVLVMGLVVSVKWAPETKNAMLD